MVGGLFVTVFRALQLWCIYIYILAIVTLYVALSEWRAVAYQENYDKVLLLRMC